MRFRNDRALGYERQHPLTELKRGLDFLVRQPQLRALAVFQTAVALLGSIGIGAAVIDLLVYRMKADFGADNIAVGMCMAAAAFGAVIGAVGAGRIRTRVSFGRIVLCGTGLQAVGLLLGGCGEGILSVTFAGGLWATGLTTRAVAATSLRQTITPDALLGRVVAAGWTLVFSASALGAILITRLATRIGTAPAMAAIGGTLGLISLAGMFSPLAASTRTVHTSNHSK